MSYWSTWFIADESDADRIASLDEDNPIDLPALILNSIIQTDIEDLADILDADYMTDMEMLHPDPMVITVPKSLVLALSNLPDEDVQSVASKWASVDDSGIRAQLDLQSLVTLMRDFCSQSIRDGKRVIELAA